MQRNGNGLTAIRVVERRARRLLRPGGLVAVEHGRAARGGGVLGCFPRSQAGGTRATTRTCATVTVFSSPWPGQAQELDMTMRYDCRDAQARTAGIDAAGATAARARELIVLPTDTVYGIGADAFTPGVVTTMLAAKGRGRNTPPPVLVGTARAAAAALAEDLGASGQDLILTSSGRRPPTLVFRASPTLLWDLGDTKGTVALRMPLHRSRSRC